MTPIKREIFHGLDGLRGCVALAVMIFHARPIFGRQLLPGAYLAVDLFFVLSGCVIAHAYDGRLARGMSPRRFVGLRLVRFFRSTSRGFCWGPESNSC